jgi:hypothetical protein
MDDHRSDLERIAKEIEAGVDGEKARLRYEIDDEGGVVLGTREGYLLLAARLIRAVLNPVGIGKERVVEVDYDAIVADDSDVLGTTLYLRDALEERTIEMGELKGSGCGIILIAGIVILVVLASIGVGAIINWFL